MKDKKIVFGAIGTYKSVTKYFMDKYEVAYIVDNDISKQGTDFYGITIYPVEKLLEEKKGEIDILIAVRSAQKEITAQLESLGFEKNKDFFFFYEKYEKNTYFDYMYWRNVIVENGKYMPTCLHIELSGVCNLKCAYCSFHGYPNIKQGHKKLITWDIVKEIARQAKEIPTFQTINACGAGEIFLHDEWFEMLQYLAQETKIPQLILYTNGMLLTKENVEKISQLEFAQINLEISISGQTSEENDDFRKGASYAVIKENVKKAAKYLDTNKVTVIIANNYIVDKNLILENDYTVPENLPIPKFMLEDFAEINKVARVTQVSPNKEGVLPESECFEFIKVHNLWGTSCVDLFATIAIDSEGNYLKCSVAETELFYRNNIMDKHMLETFQDDEQLHKDRKLRMEQEDPEFCKCCHASAKGFFVPVTTNGVVRF